MKRLPLLAFMIVMLSLATGPAAAQATGFERPSSQVLIEGAYIVPGGDLAADFPWTHLGLGAKPGYSIGFRWRYFMTPSLSISPAFHFGKFGSRTGTNNETDDWSLNCSSYRYTLELMVLKPGKASSFRPFLAAAWGIYRNRVVGFQQDFVEEFDSSVNSLGFQFRAGGRLGPLELSLAYSFNRFHTWQFFDTGYEEVYVWDNMALTLGWDIPLGAN